MRVRSLATVLVAIGCSAAGVALPSTGGQYESWAKHKPGTRVVMSGVMEMQGMRNESEQIYTLLEVTPEQVVLEAKHAAMAMGQRRELPGQRITIPAVVKDTVTTKPAGMDIQESREQVTILGKTYDARCVTTSGSQNGMAVSVKTWSSPDVPGTILKVEMTTTTEPKMTQRSELTKIELK